MSIIDDLEKEPSVTIERKNSLECRNCDEWEPNIGQINSAVILAFIHQQTFAFSPMKFCPYCGETLFKVNAPDKGISPTSQ